MINKKMILFDMDGTLLPMDINEFTNGYFKLLVKKMAPYGYDPKELISAIWAGTEAMVNNDGSRTNHDVFWKKFEEELGERIIKDRHVIEEFYDVDFVQAKQFCGFDPEMAGFIKKVKEAGYRVAVATNPLFPINAMKHRLNWAGLDPDDFELITSYEDTRYCKPNPAYYADTAARLSLAPEQCLMVGNDAEEDLVANQVGMDVFLLTPCLINNKGIDISGYEHGDLNDLWSYISEESSFADRADSFDDHFIFRNILPREWEKAAALEQLCFPPNEACKPEIMKERISKAPVLFLVAIDKKTGQLAAMIDGIATDESKFRDEFFTDTDLDDPKGRNVMITGVDVHPDYRKMGLSREMVKRYIDLARSFNKRQLFLTCKESLVPMYEKYGFVDLGFSDSKWGGEKWHEMSMKI